MVVLLHPSGLGLKCKESDLVDIATELTYHRTLTSINLSQQTISVEAATALGKSLGHNAHNIVQHVKFSECELNSFSAAPLLEAIAVNSKIEVADFSDNPLRDEGALHVARMIEANPPLRSLDISHCKIGPVGAAALGAALSVNTRLRNLSLGSNKLREAGAAAICNGLAANKHLVVVDLSGNCINSEGGMMLADLLRHNTSIESLNLATNYLSSSIPYIASAMCERGKPARLMDISSNRISSDICKTMAQVLEGHRFSIACFSVEQNDIGDDGLVALFHALKGTPIQFLDLSDAHLTSHSGVVIADLVAACTVLNSLQLDGNALGDEAVAEVAASVSKSCVASLNLERCGVGHAACVALAQAITTHKRFRTLVLADNPQVQVADVLLMLDALSTIHTLEELDLSELRLEASEDLLRAMLGVFVGNPLLQTILVGHNPMASLFEGGEGVFTRAFAKTLLDPNSVQQQQQLSNTDPLLLEGSAAKASDRSQSLMTLQHLSLCKSSIGAGSLVEQKKGPSATREFVATTFRPAWAVVIPMEHPADPPATDDDDAEDGAQVPLVPLPNSLHHPLYPGYGRGRFSSSCYVQHIGDPVPYNIAVSHGTRPPFLPTADGAAMLAVPPSAPHEALPLQHQSSRKQPIAAAHHRRPASPQVLGVGCGRQRDARG